MESIKPALLPETLSLFSEANALTPHLKDSNSKKSRKLKSDLRSAILDSGLKDGMTISFHHAFRGGDKVVNLVLDTIAQMGYKNLTLASSSLTGIHSPVVEHIKNGVVSKIYTSGIRGELGEAISHGLLKEPVHIHSHGGRVHLIKSGELNIDVAFIGVPCCDEFGNANGMNGKSRCGSLGYAKIDAQHARKVVMLTESIVGYPNHPASITQDLVDAVVEVEEVGDASKIGGGETRLTSNPRELLIAKRAADVIINSGYFKQDFSLQTGSGGASLAVTRFLENSMEKRGITAEFGLGGITSTMVSMHEKGLIRNLIDVQCFDSGAADSLARNPNHIEISANEYANPSSKGAVVDRLDVVILSALEIDVNFNVNVITGSDGVIRGASGGHCDAAAGANLAVIVAPLVRGRIPTVVEQVLNVVTPGQSIDVLVTDHGIAVNPRRPEVKERLLDAGLPVLDMEALVARAQSLTGKAGPIEYDDQVVGYVRYRDGSVIDVIRKVKSE
ncbi:citrate lyase subunit alpha [Vibrio harveyi]|uniref:citrate lyase subunit alpha n=1 Tax=Vibrio TaxID=662 RepID=UPI003BB69BED